MLTRTLALVCAASLGAVSSPPAGAQPRTGQQVYESVCAACHAAGVANAPRFGDAKAWKPLIAEGQAALSRTAIRGIRAMPPKGGRPDLTELEVRRAVAYLANAGGATWAEPAK